MNPCRAGMNILKWKNSDAKDQFFYLANDGFWYEKSTRKNDEIDRNEHRVILYDTIRRVTYSSDSQKVVQKVVLIEII